ncbi:MAG: YidC/Oxa1 family insertase periplasmic-domain containing protein [Kiritimatiellaeota bacterium]|nr:YidC/Oxa1 family insertase periplasmic-domain containing protein [Kiritimatiellota bacterium]
MNKQEKLISALLAMMLVVWMMYTNSQAQKQARLNAQKAAEAEELVTGHPTDAAITAPGPADAPPPVVAAAPELPPPALPEEVVELSSDDVKVSVSSHGATVKQVQLNRFNTRPGKAGEGNPPVLLDFSSAPGLALSGVAGLAPNASYHIEAAADGRVVMLTATTEQNLVVTRRIELLADYQIKVSDSIKNLSQEVVHLGTNTVGVGVMGRGESKNEILSADSLPDAEKLKATHWGSDKLTKALLAGGASGGCSGTPSVAGMPEVTTVPIPGSQKWVAIKSRFFVTALASAAPNSGFALKARRDMTKPAYALDSVSAEMVFAGCVLGQGEEMTRDYTLFVGPKKLALLKAMGNQMQDMMEFGFWWWVCTLLVPTLDFFHRISGSWGIAIILLTILVRIIFWPLTHRSTAGMKKMQEIQPKLKEIQAKFKDDPQKLQQETWACYRENKVNPFASCLPMLIQMPVFIALFWVLRSSVELRFAPFLWITDLSEPENLFAGMIPFIGSLNILPILMAATMGLQSALTPSTGDPQQQRMMMIMMPCMMLFFFYTFPAALSLYWTVSQVLSIAQMLMMRRKKAAADVATPPDAGESLTRQQRRAAARD